MRDDYDVLFDPLKVLRQTYLDVQIAHELELVQNLPVVGYQVLEWDNDPCGASQQLLDRHSKWKDSSELEMVYLRLIFKDLLLFEIEAESGKF